MTRAEANKEAKKLYDKWCKDKEAIENEAKENGTWETVGLDLNNHLFKAINKEAKENLKMLESMIDEDQSVEEAMEIIRKYMGVEV